MPQTMYKNVALEILGLLHVENKPLSVQELADRLTYPLVLVEISVQTLCHEYQVMCLSPASVQPELRLYTLAANQYPNPTGVDKRECISDATGNNLCEQCKIELDTFIKSVLTLGSFFEEKNSLCSDMERLLAYIVVTSETHKDMYIEMLIQFLSTALYDKTSIQKLISLVAKTLAVCTLDSKTQAQLRALVAIVRHRTSLYENGEIEDAKCTLESVLHDNEDDIFSRLILGLLYFTLGEHKNVIEAYEQYSYRPLLRFIFLHNCFCMNASHSAMNMRLFHISMGIVESSRNTAELTGSTRLSLHWRLHLIFLLLHMDKREEALLHIDHILSIPAASANALILNVANRGLALYHYKYNRFETAVRILTEDAKHTLSQGDSLSEFTDPIILEMLYDLETRTGIPIKGYELERELCRVETGTCRMLRGVALRIRGLEAREQGAPDKAISFFRAAFSELLHTGNADECLRTGVALEAELRDAGLHAEQQRLRERLAQLAAIRDPNVSTVVLGESPALGVRRCLAAFSALPALPTETEQALFRMAGIMQREMGAQRLVLFRSTPLGGFEVAATSNLTPVELRGTELKSVLDRALVYCRQASVEQPILWNNDKSAVALALFVTSTQAWMLYMDNKLGSGEFALFSAEDPQEALLFCAVVAAEIRGILRKNEGKQDGRTQNRSLSIPANDRMPPFFGETMREVLEDADLSADTAASILIQGETGTGKELLARYIHERSGKGAFLAINLACVPEHLFESELFGHERGAFTGAIRAKPGLVELAHQGVLFLDEIGDIPLALQVKLLRLLQEREFMRVGGVQSIRSEFRLIAATNRDLKEEVRQGRFREDLYYRIAVIPLTLPPLRERRDDILPLARAFRTFYATRYGRPETIPSDAQMAALVACPWSGNIRELQSVMERAVVLGRLHVPFCDRQSSETTQEKRTVPCQLPVPPAPLPFPPTDELMQLMQTYPTLADLQQTYIRLIVAKTNGKVYGKDGAAAILGMKKSTLYTKLNALKQVNNLFLSSPKGGTELDEQ